MAREKPNTQKFSNSVIAHSCLWLLGFPFAVFADPIQTPTENKTPSTVQTKKENRGGFTRNPGRPRKANGLEKDEDEWRPSVSLSVGANWINPTASFEFGITDNLSIGLVPGYYKISSSGFASTNVGAQATVNYYSDKLFEGLWIQAGPGYYQSTFTYLTTQASVTGKSFLLTGGWRWCMGRFSIAMAAGVQYFDISEAGSNGVKFWYWNPSAILHLGIIL